jgi:hypothetical protein
VALDIEKILLGVFFFVVLAGTVALLVYVVRTRQRVGKAWRAFAQRIGTLQVVERSDGWPQITGSYHGVPVLGQLVSRGSGDSRSIHTVVSATCRRQLPNNFALSAQALFFALEKAFGAQDIQLDNAEFDREFVIQAADEGAARALLADPALRQVLLEQAKNAPGLSVAQQKVVISSCGEISKPAKLQVLFEATTRAALALESATANPAMQHHAQSTAGTQRWLLHRDGNRVFAAVMVIPLALGLGLVSSAFIPPPFGGLGWLGTALLVAIWLKLMIPPKPRLVLDTEQLVLETGKERVVIPLRQCQWWCGPWHKSGYVCGSILYLQAGGQELAIAGAQHTFTDERWYQVAPGDPPAVVMLQRPFADLLNGLGYAMRRLRG